MKGMFKIISMYECKEKRVANAVKQYPDNMDNCFNENKHVNLS